MIHAASRRLACLVTLLMLAGCGFQPVYMPTASGKAGVAQRELASVYVNIIPDRPGQVLRQALQARLGDDSGTPASYDLVVSFGVSGEGVAIESDNLATRIRLIGSASWRLVDHDAKKTVLTTGSARAIDGVNVFDSQYFAADLETEAKQQSIADKIAAQITTQLAIWFRRQAEHATTHPPSA
jgi:LPS-assembly lipoprotein